MAVALITAGITFVNSMSSDTLNTISSIGSNQIELQKEKSDTDINNVLKILGEVSNLEKNTYDDSVQLKKIMNNIACATIFCLIIGTIITYIIIKSEENKASEYETFEIMIDERIKEIEKEKLSNEKKDQMEEDIKYLNEKICEYKNKTELLEDILKVKVNANN